MRNKKNYLDFIPAKMEHVELIRKDGEYVLQIQNIGMANKIAQKLFKKPKISYLTLDELGTFVWQNIDGKNSVYDIAVKMKEHFGEAAEPVYDRLVTYMRLLDNGCMVEMK